MMTRLHRFGLFTLTHVNPSLWLIAFTLTRTLADVDEDGLLDVGEYVVAMFLVSVAVRSQIGIAVRNTASFPSDLVLLLDG